MTTLRATMTLERFSNAEVSGTATEFDTSKG